jgi:hypothetical protein
MSDYKVGYRKPPIKTQIKPGECRNPYGRRGKHPKPVVDNSEAAILARLDAETVVVGDRTMTKREVELRVIQGKALSGDPRASQLLDRKRAAAAVIEPTHQGGVLVVPAPLDFDEWGSRAAKQQAKYRERNPDMPE